MVLHLLPTPRGATTDLEVFVRAELALLLAPLWKAKADANLDAGRKAGADATNASLSRGSQAGQRIDGDRFIGLRQSRI